MEVLARKGLRQNREDFKAYGIAPLTRMTTSMPPRCLLLPGWLNSGPDHWQSRWEALYSDQRVEQDDWTWPKRGDWMARLDEVILDDPRPAILIAHSLGCHLVASWAAHSRHRQRVLGALLVAPPDTQSPDLPPQLHNWQVPVRQPLPFVPLMLISSNDPYCSVSAAESLAADWGATCLEIGNLGHVNGESGLGDWPEGRALVDSLAAPLPEDDD
jgi:hypothetical protein